uniref:Uncharacterized protein n=1 Tax=Caenorhabditis japonica TaxID=281687 RepID=A0A8R1IG37_CAEJA
MKHRRGFFKDFIAEEDNATPRNRVSTNPFIRANQQHQNASHYESKNTAPPSSKNVAEVVEKMNNGDWPIQIEDDEPCQDKRAYQGPG